MQLPRAVREKALKPDEVRDILTSTADKIDRTNGGYRNGYSLKYGFGRVNADAAVTAAQRRKARRAGRAGRRKR